MIKVLFLIGVLAPLNAFGSTQDEINHLLKYVESTSCSYERNGSTYTGLEAVKHIKKKYSYFSGKIKTTEDFIKYSATKSTMSGKYYNIYCKNKDSVKSKDWLLIELNSYREKTK